MLIQTEDISSTLCVELLFMVPMGTLHYLFENKFPPLIKSVGLVKSFMQS